MRISFSESAAEAAEVKSPEPKPTTSMAAMIAPRRPTSHMRISPALKFRGISRTATKKADARRQGAARTLNEKSPTHAHARFQPADHRYGVDDQGALMASRRLSPLYKAKFSLVSSVVKKRGILRNQARPRAIFCG